MTEPTPAQKLIGDFAPKLVSRTDDVLFGDVWGTAGLRHGDGRSTVMSTWTSDELRRIGEATELRVASRRKDGSLRSYVTIWMVRVGDDIYIRSAYGTDNPWYRRAKASGQGRIRAGGVERDVTFTEVSGDADGGIDAAYHAKYDRYGAAIVSTVVGPAAAQATFRLIPDVRSN